MYAPVGHVPDGKTVEQVRASAQATADFWTEETRGADVVEVTGVTSWVQGRTGTCGNTWGMANEARTLAGTPALAGVADHLLMYLPYTAYSKDSCAYGRASLGGGVRPALAQVGSVGTTTLRLAPRAATPTAGTVPGVKVTDPQGVPFWVEYRANVGRDAALARQYGNPFGVRVLRRDHLLPRASAVLDATPPAAGRDWDHGIPVGGHWQSYAPKVMVRVLAQDAESATVEITTADAAIPVPVARPRRPPHPRPGPRPRVRRRRRTTARRRASCSR